VKEKRGGIDILFANAGIVGVTPLRSITEEHFDKTFGINVKGVLFTAQKALLLFQDGRSIILNSSIAASKGVEASLRHNSSGTSLVSSKNRDRNDKPKRRQYEVLKIICDTYRLSLSEYIQEVLIEAMKSGI
jgi:NAD(P)-dependent dehydrogenase (short-subunit alcohol dehydrogenase family)